MWLVLHKTLHYKIGSFSNGDDSQIVAIKKTLLFSNFVATIITRLKYQMEVNVTGTEFLGNEPKFKTKKKIRRLVFTSSINRRSWEFHVVVVQCSAVTAKKCTEKCAARAELMFF